MGGATAFDVILGIMLGSIVSRAVTGNAPFLPALVAAAVLLGMHWLFSSAAMRWHGFGVAIKGSPRTLVRIGELDHEALRKEHMTEHDLFEDLRSEGVQRRGVAFRSGRRGSARTQRQAQRRQGGTQSEGRRSKRTGGHQYGPNRDRGVLGADARPRLQRRQAVPAGWATGLLLTV